MPLRTRTRPERTTTSTLATTFDPRRNGLTWMRLALALTVAVTHVDQLARGTQPVLGAGTALGDLAVDGFFVISGFLVTSSLIRLGSVRRYLWHRFLRIMPGFWICLVMTAFVAAPLIALLVDRPVAPVLSGDTSASTYVVRNALLLMRQFEIDGLGSDVPGGGVVNGSLWTLAYEAACYVAVVALGIAGALTRRRWIVLSLTAVLQVLTVVQATGLLDVPMDRLLRLALMFLLGVCALVFADRIRLSVPWVLAAVGLSAGAMALLPDYRVVGAAPLAYLLLAAVATARARWEPPFDLSYGLYVYHWPVALLLLGAGIGQPPLVVAIVAVLLVTGGAAWLSWTLVERPALALKGAAWVTAVGPSRQLL